jgi:uncharacterized protein (TIGR02646 family)
MRRIARIALDKDSEDDLRLLRERVWKAKDRRGEATQLWNNKNAKLFGVVRRALDTMASGRSRCMYCEDSFGTDIEHFFPKIRYPSKTFNWNNYLFACSHCNSNLKRQQFPLLSKKPLLLDPSSDDPRSHLAFLPSSGELASIGAKGQPSIDVFALNDARAPRKLPQARKAAFLKLQLLIEEYEKCIAAGDTASADLAKQTIQDEPFPVVLGWLVAIAQGPAAASLLRPAIPGLVAKHSVQTWCTP